MWILDSILTLHESYQIVTKITLIYTVYTYIINVTSLGIKYITYEARVLTTVWWDR